MVRPEHLRTLRLRSLRYLTVQAPLRFLSAVLALLFALVVIGCGGPSVGSNIPGTPSSPSPPPSSGPTTCFSFSPARAEASSDSQTVTVQVVARDPSCSWAATDSDSWITIVRSGSLYQAGHGALAFDIESNKDKRFGGCPTIARTGRITVAEETTGAEAILQVVQQGSTTAFQPGAGCAVAELSYGTTTSGSLTGNDCRPSGSAAARYYTFQGLPNQRITIAMSGGRFVSGGLKVPLIKLYGPSSGFIVGAGGNVVIDNPRISRTLSCTGTFTLEVSSSLDSTFNPSGLGNYTLRLDSQN